MFVDSTVSFALNFHFGWVSNNIFHQCALSNYDFCIEIVVGTFRSHATAERQSFRVIAKVTGENI